MKKSFLIASALIIAYFVTRLVNLTIIPIFTDEAIYANWAQIALHDPENRFISLEDGKQPLFIWVAAILQNFFQDPLVATRLVSTLAGLGSVSAIYWLAKEIFNKKTALIAAAFYILLPFPLLYDRMGLYDSLLTMFGLFSILLTIKGAKNPRLDLSLLNGITLGLALITKSSALFFLYIIPFSVLFFSKKELFSQKLVRWGIYSMLTAFISQVIYNSLRLSPLFYMIDRKNTEFIRTLSQVITDPLKHASSNAITILNWIWVYSGPLVVVCAILALAIGITKRNKTILFISAIIFMPFFAKVLFNQVLYPRFALFYYPYIILLAAYAISKVKNVKFLLIVLAITIAWPLYNSYMIITSPTKAHIAKADKNQFLNEWPAGYGVKEVVTFLKKESASKEIAVATEGTFGLLPFAFQIYFYADHNIKITGYWPVGVQLPQQVIDSAKTKKTYFVFNEKQTIDETSKNLKFIAKYQKGEGQTFMRLYEVIP